MSIYVGEARTISTSDMQGPAPDGFHVPLITEWQGLGTIMSGLGLTTGDNWRVNLHMPFAGYRYYSTAVVNNGNNYYWSSSPYTSNYPSYARNINLSLSSINTDGNTLRANGCSVRCFKNLYVTPDSSWTVVQGTLGSAGIFWNQTDGLISITSDGATGYTIQDKNLGATTVYNKGDTLTDANCGYFYQWGNNYGFAYSGTVTTSSTRVDASNYGPGNYYNSSTFITVSSTSQDWSSVQNDNLWGGVSQGTSTTTSDIKHLYIGANEAKEVYVGTDKVRGQQIINFATQGPCPDGFHVPLNSEWQSVKSIWIALGGGSSDGTGFRGVLKLPPAGCLYNTDGGKRYDGDGCYYWSSQASYLPSVYDFCFGSNNINAPSSSYNNYGYKVRPFKNTAVKPKSSWTKLYGTSIDDGGIFWDSTSGLISLSSDGTTWITISDKNIGATIVWNQGDERSQDNCGYFYQWGNNYGFAHASASNKQSGQIDTTGYGPGNYFSNGVFVYRSSKPRGWLSVQNDNLWGGVDGNVPVS